MNTERRDVSILVERAEALAWEGMITAVPASFAEAHAMRAWRIDDAVGFMFDAPPNPIFNRVHGLGVLAPATASTVAIAVAPWDGTGRTYVIHVAPDTAPVDLPKLLQTLGFRASKNWVKMLRGTEPPPAIPTALRIEEVGVDHAAAFAEIAAQAFELPEMGPLLSGAVGRPGWHTYLAFDGDMPVAGGQLHVVDGVGWLGGGGTLPSHRGRGAQGAIMARRIHDAIALGCRHLITETAEETAEEPNPSYRNMLRTGFQLVYPRRNWIGTASST